MLAAPFAATTAIVIAVTGGGIFHQQGRDERRGVGGVDTLTEKAPPFSIHIAWGMEITIS